MRSGRGTSWVWISGVRTPMRHDNISFLCFPKWYRTDLTVPYVPFVACAYSLKFTLKSPRALALRWRRLRPP